MFFNTLNFSRNRLEAIIDPADTILTDRSGFSYALTLLVPTFPQNRFSGTNYPCWAQTIAGAVRYDGAQFRIDEVLDGFLET